MSLDRSLKGVLPDTNTNASPRKGPHRTFAFALFFDQAFLGAFLPIVVSFLALPTTTHAQVSDSLVALNPDPSTSGYFRSDTTMNEKQLFVIGETHGWKGNERIESGLFSALYSDQGVRDIVVEDGPATAYLMNRYLKSGDRSQVRSWNTYASSVRFYRSIYERCTADSLSNVVFHGIDYEDRPANIIQAIRIHMRTNGIAAPGWSHLLGEWESGRSLDRSDQTIIEEIRHVRNDLRCDSTRAHSYFGENLPFMEMMLDAGDGYETYSSTNYNDCSDTSMIGRREEMLTQNLMRLLSEFPSRKFLGIFGSLHIPYTAQDSGYFFRCRFGWRSMISKCLDRGFPKQKVIGLQLFYNDRIFYQHYGTLLRDTTGTLARSRSMVQRDKDRYLMYDLRKSHRFKEAASSMFSIAILSPR